MPTSPASSSPADAQGVASVVRDALEARRSLAIRSRGTQDGLGHASAADAVLDLSALSGVEIYEPAELVLTVGPATPIVDLEALLAQERQMLAFEPPRHATSIAGAFATNASGPRRFRMGAARDHLLGFEGVTGHGEAFVAGGRVVKNVTGYDLSKLVCGSFGTLCVLTRLHVKVWPAPEATTTVRVRNRGLDDALAALRHAVASPHDPTGAALMDGTAALRLEGPPRSVEHRARALVAELGDDANVDGAATAWWAEVRDATQVFAGSAAVWRVSLPPTDAAAFLSATAPDRWIADHAGGRVWLGYDAPGFDVRPHLLSGHATLVQAPAAMKSNIPVFHPLPPGLAALERRVKATFDPHGIFEPGRRGP